MSVQYDGAVTKAHQHSDMCGSAEQHIHHNGNHVAQLVNQPANTQSRHTYLYTPPVIHRALKTSTPKPPYGSTCTHRHLHVHLHTNTPPTATAASIILHVETLMHTHMYTLTTTQASHLTPSPPHRPTPTPEGSNELVQWLLIGLVLNIHHVLAVQRQYNT